MRRRRTRRPGCLARAVDAGAPHAAAGGEPHPERIPGKSSRPCPVDGPFGTAPSRSELRVRGQGALEEVESLADAVAEEGVSDLFGGVAAFHEFEERAVAVGSKGDEDA